MCRALALASALMLLTPATVRPQQAAGEPAAAATSGGPPPRPEPISAHGYPPPEVDEDSIVGLLKAGSFAELESLFESLERSTVDDIRNEILLDASYRSFYGSDTSIGLQLDEWVRSRPSSDAALVARSQFYHARAWEGRGEDYGVRDPRAFETSLRAAFEDAARAATLDPDNLGAYAAALRVHRALGWSPEAAALTEAALARFPTSYWLRHLALGFMEPRWGGSYELMRRFAEVAQEYADENPRLATLRTLPAIEEAFTLMQAHRYDEALATLEGARAYGVDWDFHFLRGDVLHHANRQLEALAALDSAFAMHPFGEALLEHRGLVFLWAARREVPPEQRVAYLTRGAEEMVDAVERSHTDPRLSGILADILAARASCTASPATCFAPPAPAMPAGQTSGPWWYRAFVFVASLPYALFRVFADGQRMHLLPAPLIGLAVCLWSFVEWRRQRFWTPPVIHASAVVGLSFVIGINVAWVASGEAMWTQRYVVIALFGIVPYVGYLLFLGPRYVGRKRVGRGQPG